MSETRDLRTMNERIHFDFEFWFVPF
jgi:hypothetical protein